MVRGDLAFAHGVERTEVHGTLTCVDAARRLQPNLGVAVIEVAGGVVAFTGVDSPFSQAIGVGVNAKVGDADLERLTRFYTERGATPRIVVSPIADASLGKRLAAAGYVPDEYTNALVADLDDVDAPRDERFTVATDARAWGRNSAMGFMGVDELGEDGGLIGEIIASAEGVTALEGLDEGRVAASGAMDVQGEIAGLFAGSTMAAFRGRGWQTALIRDRLARAREAGARFARAFALVASPSERNFRRAGFTALYTRARWERPNEK